MCLIPMGPEEVYSGGCGTMRLKREWEERIRKSEEFWREWEEDHGKQAPPA